jgi:hypothetical protein
VLTYPVLERCSLYFSLMLVIMRVCVVSAMASCCPVFFFFFGALSAKIKNVL